VLVLSVVEASTWRIVVVVEMVDTEVYDLVMGLAVTVDVLLAVEVNVAIGITINSSLQLTLVGNVVCLAPGLAGKRITVG